MNVFSVYLKFLLRFAGLRRHSVSRSCPRDLHGEFPSCPKEFALRVFILSDGNCTASFFLARRNLCFIWSEGICIATFCPVSGILLYKLFYPVRGICTACPDPVRSIRIGSLYLVRGICIAGPGLVRRICTVCPDIARGICAANFLFCLSRL